MHLIYVDESGKPTKKNELFVLGAIMINESDWQSIDKEVSSLRKELFGENWELFELHMSEIVNGKNLFGKYSLDERLNMIERIYDFIAGLNCRLIASVVRTERMYEHKDIELWGFRLLFDRLFWNTSNANCNLRKAGLNDQYGIVIMDSVSYSYDAKVRDKLISLFTDGSFYNDNEYLIEDMLFTKSHWRNFCDLADCVAYMVNKRFSKRKMKDERKQLIMDTAFEKLQSKFVSHNNRLSYSLKVFPK